ncbi:MAG: 50S ribosomal protein L3 [Spirochaetales bacterium]|nr:50S ribosomal protein L3 [Spirochaetales bacterium]
MIAVIGKKVGMTQVFSEDGSLVPVTVVQIEENVVVGQRTKEKNGYDAIILGADKIKQKRVIKPVAGQYPEGIEPCRYLREFRDYGKECAVGDKLGVELFDGVGFVDVIGVSKGKGSQGVMKRYGFGGGRATHGSKFHRGMGSTGQCAWPSRVFPGKKMPGHMGNVKRTVQNLEIVRVDQENKMLLLRGSVPGAINNMVIVSTAKRK